MASQESPPNTNVEYTNPAEVMKANYVAQAAGNLALHQDMGLVRVGADRYHDYNFEEVPGPVTLLQVA